MPTAPDDFSDWYRRAYPRVAAALLALIGDRAQAKEAADEAFVRAWQHWGRVAAMDSPTGWVVVVGRNYARRRLRRSAAAPDQLVVTDAFSDQSRTWDEELVESIRQLPRQQRFAVALYYAADLSLRDTAGAMGLSEGTVAATLHSARASLSTRLHDSDLAKEINR